MMITIIGPDDPALNVLDRTLKGLPGQPGKLEIIPWAEYQPRLMATLAAKEAPHQAVFIPGHVWLPELAQAGHLAALDEIPAPANEAAEHPVTDFLRAMLPAVADECHYQGKPYELPVFSDGHILFYREDLLGESISALSNESTPVISPLELGKLAAQVHHPPQIYGLALKAHPSEIFLDWLPFLWQAGGDIMDEGGRPIFASQAGVHALETYCALRVYCPPDTHLYGNAEIANAIREKRVAMATTWGGQAGPLFSAQPEPAYRCAVFPKPWNATWGVAIPANQSPELQEQVLHLLMQVLNPESDLQVIQAAGSPVRRGSYTPDFMRTFAWLPAQRTMLELCGRLPALPELGRFLGVLYPAVYKAFTGELTPRAALEAAQKQVTE